MRRGFVALAWILGTNDRAGGQPQQPNILFIDGNYPTAQPVAV